MPEPELIGCLPPEVDDDQSYRQLSNAFLEFADFESGGTIVDVGSGPGTLLWLLELRGVRPKSAWAVDPDPRSRAIARQRIGKWAGVLDGKAEDFGELFPPDTADAVLFGNSIHLAPDVDIVLEHVLRVCRPGGIVALSTGFYANAAPLSDRPIYTEVMVRAYRLLRKQGSIAGRHRPSVRVPAKTAASVDFARRLVDHGFMDVRCTEYTLYFGRELTLATIGSPLFAAGAFPGVEPKAAADALRSAAEQLYERMGEVPLERRYLFLAGRIPDGRQVGEI